MPRIHRRALLASAPAMAMLPAFSGFSDTRPASFAVDDLKIAGAPAPLALEDTAPLLSWKLRGTARGLRQSACRIQVASSLAGLRAGHADLWDSGRLDNATSIGLPYRGRPLASRQDCYWQVTVWNEAGEAARSEIARFSMGLLSADDWHARWLVAEDADMTADRSVGLRWVGGAEPGARRFRTSITTQTPTNLTLILIGSGPTRLFLDGTEQSLPPYSPVAFGAAPAAVVERTLPPGAHRIEIAVGLNPQPFSGIPHSYAECAAFLKLEPEQGGVTRSDTGNFETRLEAAPDSDYHPVQTGRITGNPWPAQPGVYLRRSFQLSKNPIARARLYATALGAYIPHLNGVRIDDRIMAPEISDFRQRVRYQLYDVTGHLREGRNCLGALVGDGWYASYMAPRGRFPLGLPPRRFLGQLEITYQDGTIERIMTDSEWEVARSAVQSAEIYNGETYDARAEIPGWSNSGSRERFAPAALGEAPGIALSAQIAPPIRPISERHAIAITEPEPGRFVFDFGQNFAGFCRLRVRGAAGQAVTLRFAEILKKNGTIDQSNLRGAAATDRYILRGDPHGETYQPHFTYHGFRYAEISGFPGTPDQESLIGIVAHSDLAETGTLTIDNPLIQSLWRISHWSQRSNLFGLPTDCPQRDERLGWMGDANVFWDAACFNMDMDRFTAQFSETVRDSQAPDGAFSDVSPNTIGYFGIGASPGWADAGVTLPFTAWQRYGDTSLITENWAAMTRYLGMILRLNPDGIWRYGRGADFGDWLALDAKNPGDPTTPKDLIGTAVWQHDLNCMAQMGDAIGRNAEATAYRRQAVDQRRAFSAAFIGADGRIGNDSQTGAILALRYGLVPDRLRDKAAARLIANIRRRSTVLSTGFLGTPNSLDVLADAGADTLVYDLLLRTAYPSWGYMVVHGATTTWERWNGDSGDTAMNSFNHYALGAVCGFLWRRIAAIAPSSPGFATFRIAPVFDRRVPKGGGRYESASGRIETAWSIQPHGTIVLEVEVPPNSSALVDLPGTGTVRESGRDARTAPGVRAVRTRAHRTEISLSAGRYRLETG